MLPYTYRNKCLIVSVKIRFFIIIRGMKSTIGHAKKLLESIKHKPLHNILPPLSAQNVPFIPNEIKSNVPPIIEPFKFLLPKIETGVTAQNMLEFQTINNCLGSITKYLKHNLTKEDNVQFMVKNALIALYNNTVKLDHGNQRNSDVKSRIWISEKGLERSFDLDVKLISNPALHLMPINGNMSITTKLEPLLFMERFKGSLHAYYTKNMEQIELFNWFKELDAFLQQAKKNPRLPNISFNVFNEINYFYLIKTNTIIMPSIITENTNYLPLDLWWNSNEYGSFEDYMNKLRIINQEYFPIMGMEDSTYPLRIENFIKKLPPTLRDKLLENRSKTFEMLKDSLIKYDNVD